MNDLPLLLSEWLRDNAWDPIAACDDMMDEANHNMHRLFLSTEDAKAISVADICKAFNIYSDIMKSKLVDNRFCNLLLYVWHDEMSGSLCISCISNSHLPAMPFACRVNTNVSLDEIVTSFLNSKYLDGIPTNELQTIQHDHDADLKATSDGFVLSVYTQSCCPDS